MKNSIEELEGIRKGFDHYSERTRISPWPARIVGFLLGVLVVCILVYFTQSKAAEARCGEIRVTEVVDGDTLRGQITGLPSPLNRISIRVMGIDTPEKRGKCAGEKALAKEATAFLKEKFQQTQSVELRWVEWDKYGGRILADVYFDDKSVSEMMIKNKLATPYAGGKKLDWCQPILDISTQKD